MPQKDDKDRIEFNFGTGRISFGGLFKGLGNLVDLASRLGEEGTEKEGEIGGLPKGAKGVYGFSVRTFGGKPIIETFGNLRETDEGPTVAETREPMVDVFDEGTQIRLIAELPGVAEEKIEVEANGDILTLSASDGERKYAKEVLLPARVKAEPVKRTYKNGILEVTLQKESA
jgi:HSP20 family protein